jgi:hypothetical protein
MIFRHERASAVRIAVNSNMRPPRHHRASTKPLSYSAADSFDLMSTFIRVFPLIVSS